MSFADRAIAACDRAMGVGNLSERHVRDVLRCNSADVRPIAKHLESCDQMVRRAAARIIGKLGDVQPLLDAALREEVQPVLLEMISVLGKRGEGTSALERMVSSQEPFVREGVISMLRRSGKADSLLPLIFDSDDDLVRRVKRYINEQESASEEPSPGRPD